jgi:hypothetical protein
LGKDEKKGRMDGGRKDAWMEGRKKGRKVGWKEEAYEGRQEASQ